jgi:hypothetical protein
MTPQPIQRGGRPARRPSRAARRVGYLLSAAISIVVFWLLNVSPGWRSLTFLTDDFAAVVGLLNASLALSVVINLAYVAHDAPWAKHLGDAVNAAVAFGVVVLTATVFPFALGGPWAGWETPLRVVLVLAAVGCVIAVIANLVGMARLFLGGARDATTRRFDAPDRQASTAKTS